MAQYVTYKVQGGGPLGPDADLIEHAGYESARAEWLYALLTDEPRTIAQRSLHNPGELISLDPQFVLDHPHL